MNKLGTVLFGYGLTPSGSNSGDTHIIRIFERKPNMPANRAIEFLALVIAAALCLAESALALPPEQHPSLLYEAEDLPTLRERIARAPYAEWWGTLQSQADQFLSWDPADVSDQKNRAIDAKMLAFVYALSEETQYAEKAVEFLRAVSFPPRGGDLGELHSEAEAAMCYAEAYDMLTSYLSDPVDQGFRQVLYEEGHWLYEAQEFWYASHKMNKQIRHYSGLGLCALVLSDYAGPNSTPQQWHEKAMTEVTAALEYQADTDGGFAEGPFYHRYSADLYVPYMLALRRIAGVDLLAQDEVRALHIWSLKIRMPSGGRPNTDDAQITGFFSGALASAYSDGGLFAWDWTAGGAYTYRHYAVDAICLFDDGIAPEPPSWTPTCFLPEAGDAAFRSDWGPDATYLLLKGEHGVARDRGKSHEHPDATSFVLFARDEILALDAGYISWPQHDKVNGAKNHNLILVDGKGPPLHKFFGTLIGAGVDAYIERSFGTDFLDYCEVLTEYEGVQFRRRVAFPGKTYFLVLDELSSDAVHRYDWLLHGNGGGTSGGTFERMARGGRWRIGDAELLSYVAFPEDVDFEEGEEIHSFEYEQELTHTVLKAVHTASDARYLTVLFPKGSDESDPSFERLFGKGGTGVRIVGEGFTDLMLVRDSDAASLTLESQDIGGIETDAGLLFVRTDADGPRALTLWAGGEVKIQDTLYVSAIPGPPIVPGITLSIRFGEEVWNGYIRPEVESSLSLHTSSPPTAVYLDEVRLSHTYAAGKTTFIVPNAGALRVSFESGPAGDFDGDGAVNLNDFLLFVAAFGYSATDAGFDPTYDLDGDDVIGLGDFLVFVAHFGEKA